MWEKSPLLTQCDKNINLILVLHPVQPFLPPGWPSFSVYRAAGRPTSTHATERRWMANLPQVNGWNGHVDLGVLYTNACLLLHSKSSAPPSEDKLHRLRESSASILLLSSMAKEWQANKLGLCGQFQVKSTLTSDPGSISHNAKTYHYNIGSFFCVKRVIIVKRPHFNP